MPPAFPFAWCLLLAACAVPPRMCVSQGDCGGRASCVAGRCVAQGATAAIDSGRRLIFAPVDIAYLRADGDGRDAVTATLGGAHDAGAVVLVRFSIALPPETNVLEAYLLLDRATDIDADPGAVALHACRVTDPWDSRSVSWARQPRVEDAGSPVTRLSRSAGPMVRLEVHDIVRRWRRRTGVDEGIAVTAEGKAAVGLAFALAPAPGSGRAGPRLELYVK
jgi:hypothetical protein